MTNKLTSKYICFLTIIALSAASLFAAMPPTQAATPIMITVIGANGISNGVDISLMTATIGAGGYKSNSQTQAGNFQGVSIIDLCNVIGTPLQSYQNVTVTTSGGSGTSVTFNYEQVTSGTNIYPQYSTYNNITGALQAPTKPVTLIVAYQQANGTALPGSGTATRLLIVGPEGLLFQGPGLAGVVNVTITNVGPVPTPTPAPTPVATPTPIPTTHPTASPNPSNTPTTQPTTSPTPTSSPSPTPTSTSSSEWPITYTATIAAIIITIVIVAAALILKRK